MNKKLMILGLMMTVMFIIKPSLVLADDNLSLSASIDPNAIVDGTPSWDDNDEAGNDSSPNNGIVRSFDTITYPLKVTLNNDSDKDYSDIELLITGEVDNPITGNTVNAIVDQNPNPDPFKDGKSTFSMKYTLPSTGNAVTIPIIMDVNGASNGTKIGLKNVEVKVVSAKVDGKKENLEALNIVNKLPNDLPKTTVSSKVSIELKQRPWNSGSMQFVYPMITNDKPYSHDRMMMEESYDLIMIPLKGKTNMKGSALPNGKVDIDLKYSQEVEFDGESKQEVVFNEDNNIKLFDYFHIDRRTNKKVTDVEGYESNPNTQVKNEDIDFRMFNLGNASSASSFVDGANLPKWSVFDSGRVEYDKRTSLNEDKVTIDGFRTNGVYPSYRMDGYEGTPMYNSNQKAFSTYKALLSFDNAFLPGSDLNPNSKANTLYMNVDARVSGYEQDGRYIKLDNNYTREIFTLRNDPDGSFSNIASWLSPTEKTMGTTNTADPQIPFGDGQRMTGNRILMYGRNAIKVSRPTTGDRELMVYWNADAVEFNKNHKEPIVASYRSMVFGSQDITTNQVILYGVNKDKNNPYLFDKMKNYTYDDFEWFSTVEEAEQVGQVSAVKQSTNDSILSSVKASNMFIQGIVKTTKLGSEVKQGEYNTVMSYSTVKDKDGNVVMKSSTPITRPTIYDSENQMTQLQSPVGSATVRFDTFGVIPLTVTTKTKTDKTHYYSTDEITLTSEYDVIMDENNKVPQVVELYMFIPKGVVIDTSNITYNGELIQPKLEEQPDGTTKLTHTVEVVGGDKLHPIVVKGMFDTTSLTFNNNVANLESKSEIWSEQANSVLTTRQSTHSFDVTKIAQLGISQKISKDRLELTDEFDVDINSYTTTDGEKDVKVLWSLPDNSEQLSLSSFTKSNDKQSDVYVSKVKPTETDPNLIDLSSWVLYEDGMDISEYQSVIIHYKEDIKDVDGTILTKVHLTNKKDKSGHKYIFQATSNSQASYPTSPESNKVLAVTYERNLSGLTWFDYNEDGLIDDDEKLLNNATVTLLKKGQNDEYAPLEKDINGDKVTAIKTKNDGSYEFNKLPSGDYKLSFSFDELDNYVFTKQLIGDNNAINSNTDSSGVTNNVNLPLINELVDFNTVIPHINSGIYFKPVNLNARKNWVGVAKPTFPVDFSLIKNDETVDTVTLTPDNGYTHTWSNLERYSKDLTKHSYKVKEDTNINGYESQSSSSTNENGDISYSITNTYSPNLISKKVTKKWVTTGSESWLSGTPNSVDVALLRNGDEVSRITLNDNNNWEHEFSSLPEIDEYGNPYTYTFKELTEIDGYTSSQAVDEQGVVITNTYAPEKTSFEVKKEWANIDDEIDHDVTLTLLANGVETNISKVASKSNNYTVVFDNLPKTDLTGQLIKYDVLEKDMLDNYAVSYDKKANGDITVTNTLSDDRINLTVNKIWKNVNMDELNQEITVFLVEDGNKTTKSLTLNKSNGYMGSFDNLKRYNSKGKEIDYTVVEEGLEDYDVSYNKLENNYIVIENEYNPETTEIDVTKLWMNVDDNETPETINVDILQNGKHYQSIVLDKSEAYFKLVTGLPIKDINGKEYEYAVKELSEIDGYDVTYDKKGNQFGIINTYNPPIKSDELTKVWSDIDKIKDAEKLPSLEFDVYQNETLYDTVTISHKDDWSIMIKDLPQTDTMGRPYTYRVEEKTSVNGYIATVDSKDGKFVVTNTYEPELTSVSISKEWFNVSSDVVDGLPDVEVTLYGDGDKVKDVTLNQSNGYKETISDLPKYNRLGNEVVYTVEETTELTDYTSSVSNIDNSFVVANTYDPELTNIDVDKDWLLLDKKSAKDLPEITVSLQANGKDLGLSMLLNKENKYHGQFEGLPVRDELGNDIEYKLFEVDVPNGYENVDKDGVVVKEGKGRLTNKELPGEPTEPNEPTEPVEPTEPIEPIDPTDPINPTDPTDPINPTDPTDPTDPNEANEATGDKEDNYVLAKNGNLPKTGETVKNGMLFGAGLILSAMTIFIIKRKRS